MATLTLTALQRLNLHGVVNSKRYEDEEDALMFREFSKEIDLPSAERKALFQARTNELIPEMVEKLEGRPDLEKELEIERAVARKVLARMKEWKTEFKLSPVDTDWYIPLRKQLETLSGT